MKYTLLFIAGLGLLVSCSNNETTKVLTDTSTTIVRQYNSTSVSRANRRVLIDELKRLQSVFVTNDKEKITGVFQFPLSDTTVDIYIDDRSFNAQYEKNRNKLTRGMFIQYFPQISEELQLGEMNQLFKKIKLDQLQQTDTLEAKTLIKTEPCYHYYGVRIEKDLVTLTVGTNSNNDYKSEPVTENKTEEGSDELCEHVLWWTFKCDGQKLHFKSVTGAG